MIPFGFKEWSILMPILSIVTLFHLAGLIMGLGGAMLADYTTLTRGVIRPVTPYTIHQVEFLSRIVSAGLAILWLSGIAIIWLNTEANPEYIANQKLWAKVAIVAVLTVNGFAVHGLVLPHLQDSLGYRLFDQVGSRRVAVMTLVGAFSVVSWVMPFVLAKASNLNYVTPVGDILAFYAAAILGVWVAMFALMRSIAGLQGMARRAAAMTLKQNDDWEIDGLKQAA